MADFVQIFEMSPRDGLQNEKKIVTTPDKIKLVNALSECGFAKIEVTSFVSPKWVPQMSDATEVMTNIIRKPGISYTALTPNLRGFEAALEAGADEVAIFASASEGFSQNNINCSIAESLERYGVVVKAAQRENIPVRGYVSCVTDCPFDGPTPPEKVAAVTASLLMMGCYEVSLGDTIGTATPQTTTRMLEAVLMRAQIDQLAGHFHDTKGRALANIQASLNLGLRVFDASVGGLGGCPYAPGAQGNVATEAVVIMLQQNGFETGIDVDRLNVVANFAKTLRSSYA